MKMSVIALLLAISGAPLTTLAEDQAAETAPRAQTQIQAKEKADRKPASAQTVNVKPVWMRGNLYSPYWYQAPAGYYQEMTPKLSRPGEFDLIRTQSPDDVPPSLRQ